MTDRAGGSRLAAKAKKFLENPKAFFADSRIAPLRPLAHVLPGKVAEDRFRLDPSRHIAEDRFPQLEDKRPVTTSRPLSRNPALATFLGQWPKWRRFGSITADDMIFGWGYRTSGRNAQSISAEVGTRGILLEDGFLRSVDRHGHEIGMNFDEGGIYYSANSPSRLFDLISRPLDDAQAKNALELAASWQAYRLSKYNDGPEYNGPLPDRFALVVDQVRNDLSIEQGLADQGSFDRMLQAALDSGLHVVLKVHPDSAADPQKRHFDLAALAQDPRITIVREPCHIASLIARCDALYCVTSQAGFEGLLWHKPVHVFGMPFYAGWGLTQDALAPPAGRGAISFEQLVHAALVAYPRYYNPVTRRETGPQDAFSLVGLNRRYRTEMTGSLHAIDFSPWKRPFIRAFLSGNELTFVDRFEDIPMGGTVLRWGRKDVPANRTDLCVIRVEDGFLRSSGLGANLVRPLSLVADRRGIYYDATGPSDLEDILNECDYDDRDRDRAARLRRSIIDLRLSKYNLGGHTWQRPDTGAHVVLAVGQVEADASIRYGSPEVKTNIELLRRVRAAHPDAYLLYKPHPDVVAGLRRGDTQSSEISALVDEIVTDVDPVQLLDHVDHVHTITSLMGFEALLRGKTVTCHGLPFYAGWGLTEDRLACKRRSRVRTLDELVHATLIDYPRYFSPRGGIFAPPEDILVELADLAALGPAQRSLPRRILYYGVTRWVKWRAR